MARRITLVDDVVRFDAPAPTVFDYLTDPRNRAQWQSSLRRVDDVAELGDRPGDVGTSWTDVTVVPGVAPRLEVTACEPPRLWREIGTWRSVDAVLTLELDDRDGGTDVRAQAILTVAGCSSDSDSDSTAADTTAASGVESCPAEPTKADASPQWTLKGATGELEVVAATENEAPKITVEAPFKVDETEVKTLVEGDGEVVAPTATVTVCYLGVNGRTGESFDGNYREAAPRRPSRSTV